MKSSTLRRYDQSLVPDWVQPQTLRRSPFVSPTFKRMFNQRGIMVAAVDNDQILRSATKVQFAIEHNRYHRCSASPLRKGEPFQRFVLSSEHHARAAMHMPNGPPADPCASHHEWQFLFLREVVRVGTGRPSSFRTVLPSPSIASRSK